MNTVRGPLHERLIKVWLCFPHTDIRAELPAVPRVGELLAWEVDAGTWSVTEVLWTVREGAPGDVALTLDPAGQRAEQVVRDHG